MDPLHPHLDLDPSPDPLSEPETHPAGRPIVLTLLALLVLTAISWIMSHVPLGALSTPVALAIAAVKAGLVAVWFMELPRASAPAKITALVTISFIALLASGIVGDIAMR